MCQLHTLCPGIAAACGMFKLVMCAFMREKDHPRPITSLTSMSDPGPKHASRRLSSQPSRCTSSCAATAIPAREQFPIWWAESDFAFSEFDRWS